MNQRTIGRVVLLSNPAAGGGHAERAAARAAARLRAGGVQVLNISGADPQDALRLARETVARGVEQGGVDALVAVGGDGMVHLAVQALAGSGIPFGLIPAGTGNDLAREYGLPIGDPEAAADVVAEGRVRTVDLGRIEDADGAVRYFATVLAVGFDSLVSDRVNRLTWPRGRMRYNLAILVELANLRPLPFKLVLDGETVLVRDLTLAAVGNTRSYGGGMSICPGADPGDGTFDLTLIGAMKRSKLIRFFPTVFKGTHVRHQEVDVRRASTVRIESPGITAYADGEFVAPLPVDVGVARHALGVLVP
ncbi:diacylglycerol kinase [Kitasatospora sp. NPDC048365]|uniref:diacylglycerol kinase n=1 Tax=Kitasatospora sp. NPDC048365 TaxID=3364050 RepID=UPI0037194398